MWWKKGSSRGRIPRDGGAMATAPPRQQLQGRLAQGQVSEVDERGCTPGARGSLGCVVWGSPASWCPTVLQCSRALPRPSSAQSQALRDHLFQAGCFPNGGTGPEVAREDLSNPLSPDLPGQQTALVRDWGTYIEFPAPPRASPLSSWAQFPHLYR